MVLFKHVKQAFQTSRFRKDNGKGYLSVESIRKKAKITCGRRKKFLSLTIYLKYHIMLRLSIEK